MDPHYNEPNIKQIATIMKKKPSDSMDLKAPHNHQTSTKSQYNT
jgi:hypothetical protein